MGGPSSSPSLERIVRLQAPSLPTNRPRTSRDDLDDRGVHPARRDWTGWNHPTRQDVQEHQDVRTPRPGVKIVVQVNVGTSLNFHDSNKPQDPPRRYRQ